MSKTAHHRTFHISAGLLLVGALTTSACDRNSKPDQGGPGPGECCVNPGPVEVATPDQGSAAMAADMGADQGADQEKAPEAGKLTKEQIEQLRNVKPGPPERPPVTVNPGPVRAPDEK